VKYFLELQTKGNIMSNAFKILANMDNANNQYHTFAVGQIVYRDNDKPQGIYGFVYTIDPDHWFGAQQVRDEHIERIVNEIPVVSELTPVLAPTEAANIVPVSNNPAVEVVDANTTETASKTAQEAPQDVPQHEVWGALPSAE
jgi:hypothetical protein